MAFFLQNVINALQWGSFYALIALGYSMVYSILMLFNFTHGDVFMTGAYIGFGVATALLALTAAIGWSLPGWMLLVLTIIIAMFVTSFLGVLIERVGYRPLRDAPRASAAITGLMIGIMLEYGNLAILGTQRFNFPSIIDTVTYDVGGVFFTNKKILIVGVALLLMIALHLFIQKSRWGMAMRAMSYDFQVVPLMGVSLNVTLDLCHRIIPGRSRRYSLRYGLSCAGSFHGNSSGLEIFCGCHSRWSGIDSGSGTGRILTRFHRNFHGHGISFNFQGPDHLQHYPFDIDVQALRIFRSGPQYAIEAIRRRK